MSEHTNSPSGGSPAPESPVAGNVQPTELREIVADTDSAPLLEIREVTKTFGSVISLSQISTTVRAGQVTCVLGDNGAGKSTFIKMLSGVHQPDQGELLVDGRPVRFNTPRDALDAGIATVFQDLAMVPLMAIWRNFFLGSEPTRGRGPFRRFDTETAKRITRTEMAQMGIDIRDTDQPVGTLSGGERQCVAIARAVHFGARLLILDEPTSALGVKQSGVVLKYIVQARDRGLGVIFITHNPHHAYPVGDRFLLLKRGKSLGDFAKSEISLAELTGLMAGGAELEQLAHELERDGDDSETAELGRALLADTQPLP
ncbi:MAG: ATP-binding cassette domain-containing protein [Jatrophihabitans sp.]